MAQSLVLVPGAGAQSRRTVSMETGSLETFSGITPWGSLTETFVGLNIAAFGAIHQARDLAGMWLWNKCTECDLLTLSVLHDVFIAIRGSIS